MKKSLTFSFYLSYVRSVLINSLTDDLSANKTAQQYKTHNNDPNFAASKAVDGDISSCARMKDIGTTSSDKSTWWYVDLGGIYNVYNIRIQFKDYAQYSKLLDNTCHYSYKIGTLLKKSKCSRYIYQFPSTIAYEHDNNSTSIYKFQDEVLKKCLCKQNKKIKSYMFIQFKSNIVLIVILIRNLIYDPFLQFQYNSLIC